VGRRAGCFLSAAGFRERALAEAARYGPDAWVFVRELLQNARDAGARSVAIETAADRARERVACRDDGAGMSFEHARRFLFALYASSKGGPGDAGRFGVGFWSVLRFQPQRIVVRSWPRRGAAWEVVLDGELRQAERAAAPPRRGSGSEVVLERATQGEDVAACVLAAAGDAGRFLLRRDAPRPLRVSVNGTAIGAPFDLPAPRARFRRGRERGVVALGREPRCELFAKGLKVRTTSCLEELLSAATGGARVAPSPGEGLAPQALLDGEGLEVLLARGDARSNRALARLVARAERELGRLVEAQIAAARPASRRRRALGLVGAAVMLAAGTVAGVRALAARPRPGLALGDAVHAPGSSRRPATDDRPYRDLGRLYRGPDEQGLAGASAPLALRYSPSALSPSFAAVVVEPGEGAREARAAHARSYLAADAGAGARSIGVELAVENAPGWVRLPVPTGHRIDPRTLRVAGAPAALFESDAGEPLIEWRDASRHVVSYSVTPARAADDDAIPEAVSRSVAPAGVPDSHAHWLDSVRTLPVEERAAQLAARVAQAIRYSASPEAASRMRARREAGEDFAAAALAVGAGDCDVQNGLLALLLRASGVPARLVVGYVGREGAVLPGLHAWVEYASDGRWLAADASRDGAVPPTAAAAALSVAGPPPVLAAPAATVSREAGHVAPGAAWGVGAALAGLGLAALGRRRTRRDVTLDPAPDLAALVVGAVRRPDAFAAAPAVFEAPLLPTQSGKLVSVSAAWSAAAAGRLFASQRAGPLARSAARRGARVLDTRNAEARAAAEALGACDLDEWDALLARARSTPLLLAVTDALGPRDGALLLAAGGVEATTLLDLGVRGALPGAATRALALGERDACWQAAERRFAAAPAEAVLALAEHVLAFLGVSEDRRARRLAKLAGPALREAAR
jgi:hypothetical protein